MPATHFVAADIGNARIKLGLFTAGDCPNFPLSENGSVPFDAPATSLHEPLRTLPFVGKEPELDRINPWLQILPSPFGRGAGGEGLPVSLPPIHPNPLPKREGTCGHVSGNAASLSPLTWWIASVNRPAATRLIDWLHEHRPTDRVVLLASGDLPLVVRLERPDMVGIDRLVDAVAVNRLRDPSRPAVIVDVGTAITVDLVSADGAFLGGSILPGIQMAARALHHFTDLLPLVSVSDLSAPPSPLGTSTESAMQAGLFWGAVGAIRQLIDQLSKAATSGRADGCGGSSTTAPIQVFLTGGAGAAVAELLGHKICHVPNLTLSGIAQIALERTGDGSNSPH